MRPIACAKLAKMVVLKSTLAYWPYPFCDVDRGRGGAADALHKWQFLPEVAEIGGKSQNGHWFLLVWRDSSSEDNDLAQCGARGQPFEAAVEVI